MGGVSLGRGLEGRIMRRIRLDVVGGKDEIRAFLELCLSIEYLGIKGMNRSILVDVDGDGSGRLNFFDQNNNDLMWDENDKMVLNDYCTYINIGE
jgi:hypothetical protein